MQFKTHRRNASLVLPSQYSPSQRRKSTQQIISLQNHQQLLQKAKHAYYNRSDFAKAVMLFEQYLNFYPKSNQALYLCGVACLQINRSHEAIQKLKLVGQDYFHHSNAMLLTAIATNRLGSKMRSLEIMDQCLRIYPQFEQGLCFRGRLHMQLGCFMQAENDFQLAVSSKKASYLGYIGLGDCYRALGRFENALPMYEQARYTVQQLQFANRSSILRQIALKFSICYYHLERYSQALQKLVALSSSQEINSSSQCYYYRGLCQIKLNQVEKGLFNLQYCMRLQSDSKIVQKAYRRLICNYLEKCQFYQANDIVQLGDKCGVKLENWKKMVEGFMAVIKNRYAQGLVLVSEVLDAAKDDKVTESKLKIQKDSIHELKGLRDPIKIELPQFKKKNVFLQSPKVMEGPSEKNIRRKLDSFSKSVAKAIAKIGSVRNYKNTIRVPHQILRNKTQDLPSSIARTAPNKQKKVEPVFTANQKQIVYPLLLKFKAYSQFFQGHYLAASQTYQDYESHVKDMYGGESDLQYHRLLSEALLLSEQQMADQALSKFGQCIDCYFQKYGSVPVEPILYKLCLLIRLAAVKTSSEQQQPNQSQDSEVASSSQILISTLSMITNYQEAIRDHHLAHYFHGIVYAMQEQHDSARQCLEKTLKMAEECSWKFLYVKGVIQLNLGHYADAIKEFSAGLILEIRAELYLGRAIGFYLLSETGENNIDQQSFRALMKSVTLSSQLINQKSTDRGRKGAKGRSQVDTLIENCFGDLQKFIEFAPDKNDISRWVSRLLFATRSYEQALSSLSKVQLNSYEFVQMSECIQIYQGEFEHGGGVGLLIKYAFDGNFLTQTEQSSLLTSSIIKNYNNPDFEYLNRDYQKWLVILHLYVKGNYVLLLKYLQKELFQVKEEIVELLLRYNLFVVYLILGEAEKGSNIVKGLIKFEKKYHVQHIIEKVSDWNFEDDQCVGELKEAIGVGDNRLLSNSLAYKKVSLNVESRQVRVFVRVNIPFPRFPPPNLDLKIDSAFILKEVDVQQIDKKIDAPWIRKNNNIIQFTDKLDQSKVNEEDISSSRGGGSSSSRLFD